MFQSEFQGLIEALHNGIFSEIVLADSENFESLGEKKTNDLYTIIDNSILILNQNHSAHLFNQCLVHRKSKTQDAVAKLLLILSSDCDGIVALRMKHLQENSIAVEEEIIFLNTLQRLHFHSNVLWNYRLFLMKHWHRLQTLHPKEPSEECYSHSLLQREFLFVNDKLSLHEFLYEALLYFVELFLYLESKNGAMKEAMIEYLKKLASLHCSYYGIFHELVNLQGRKDVLKYVDELLGLHFNHQGLWNVRKELARQIKQHEEDGISFVKECNKKIKDYRLKFNIEC